MAEGIESWNCNLQLDTPKFIPHPNYELDLFAVVASLTPQSHFNSQLLKAFCQLGLLTSVYFQDLNPYCRPLMCYPIN